MKLGAALIDITPAVGAELSGFAARTQPSLGVHDRLYLRGIHLSEGDERLLWLHCDVIGLDESIVARFRDWAFSTLGLRPSQVMVSATHTHSGPCTIHLTGAGDYDEAYVEFLITQLQVAAGHTVAHMEPCTVVTGEDSVALAVHRRGPATAHTDPRVGVVGFRRDDGSYIAVIGNYAVHPVALGRDNRQISADLFGVAADGVSRGLRGAPLVLMTNGACGNLNPPAEDVSFEQLAMWGGQIAQGVLRGLDRAQCAPVPGLRTTRLRCPLPLEFLNEKGIEVAASKAVASAAGSDAVWREKLSKAVTLWRATLLSEIANGRALKNREIELFAVRLGQSVFLGIDAEVFSIFTAWLRRDTGLDLYTVGYANGNWGYLSPGPAYAEGGYEVEEAHYFYGGYRFAAGALETLAENATKFLLREAHPLPVVRP